MAWAAPVLAGAPWATTVGFKEASALKTVTIANGPATVRRTRTFPPVAKQPGQIVALRFTARVEAPRAVGRTHGLGILVNGARLTALTPARTPRVVNRSGAVRVRRVAERLVPLWGNSFTGTSVLLISYGPGGGELDPAHLSDREEGYWYVIDISDLVKGPEDVADKKSIPVNELTLGNHILKHHVRGADASVIVEHIAVGLLAEADVRKQLALKSGRIPGARRRTYADGTFEGKANVKGCVCKVAVTIRDERMTRITILDLQDDDTGQQARALVPRVLKEQTTAVDAVTGATYSSKALLQAVDMARRAAAAARAAE